VLLSVVVAACSRIGHAPGRTGKISRTGPASSAPCSHPRHRARVLDTFEHILGHLNAVPSPTSPPDHRHRHSLKMPKSRRRRTTHRQSAGPTPRSERGSNALNDNLADLLALDLMRRCTGTRTRARAQGGKTSSQRLPTASWRPKAAAGDPDFGCTSTSRLGRRISSARLRRRGESARANVDTPAYEWWNYQDTHRTEPGEADR
jgi:hypothetical protein